MHERLGNLSTTLYAITMYMYRYQSYCTGVLGILQFGVDLLTVPELYN